MEELVSQLTPIIINAVIVVVGFIFTRIGFIAKDFFDDKTKRAIAEQTVMYVKQIGDAMDASEKLAKAKEDIQAQLAEKGIRITDLELTVLIESAVNNFKGAWNSDEGTPNVDPSESEVSG